MSTTEVHAFCTKRQKRAEALALSQGDQGVRAPKQRKPLGQRRPAVIACQLALAHTIAADIERGRYASQADAARHFGLTRARLSQLMKLLCIAPDIQEEILALEHVAGRGRVTERRLKPVSETPLWSQQRALWATMRPKRS